ncbi:MAG: ABC transporter ATP-binding protein [Anaerolineae bacterium]|nr:ABC transporter ATP-binding protein [Anaerolineae bacterium]
MDCSQSQTIIYAQLRSYAALHSLIMIPSPIIETRQISRDFKKKRAVNALDLSIQTGELFGIVGPDGAGKTTILRLLAGLLTITDGSGIINGFDLAKQSESIKAQIGYMAQSFSLYSKLSVLENLNFFAELYNVSTGERAERTKRLLSFAGLTEFKDRRASHLSGGMQKKLALACTLIHEPPILLLDEPTTGVDPVSRREFWNILTELHLANTTIVVSTPYMDEADRCSRVGLIYAGELVICDQPRNIRAQVPGELIELFPEDRSATLAYVRTLPGVLEVQTYGEALHLIVDSGEKRLNQIENSLIKQGLEFRAARLAPIRMEEAFISLIQQMDNTNNQDPIANL